MVMLRVQRYARLFLALLLSVFVLSFYSCGGGYESPPALSQSPLISPQTLNGWITEGYSDEYGYNKMVILHITKTPGNYNVVGHIPGAYLVDFTNDIHDERFDGIANIKNDVPTRSKIEGLLRKFGVDQKTVIILTGDDITHSTRTYFTLRYWGFPRWRIKVLNGSTKTWQDSGYALETTSPSTPVYSDFSICQFQQNTSIRATLNEMIDVVEGRIPNAVIIDTRANEEYGGVAKKSKSYTTGGINYYEPFEGHMKGALNQNYVELLKNKNTKGDNGLLSEEELREIFNSLGIDATKTVYGYCHTGRRASLTFFVLEAILGYNVKLYDSGWWEWGKMAKNANKGILNEDSPWRTDILSRSEVIVYNIGFVGAGEDIATVSGTTNSYATRADLVDEEDALSCGAGGEGGGGGGGFPPPGC